MPQDPHALVTLATNIDEAFYNGPRFRSLSKEMKEQLKEFLAEVGVADAFADYVAQATYYAENEEYQKWLARIAHFAEPTQ